MQKKKKKETLCWICKNSCAGCSWSRFGIPVKGWKVEPTYIKGNGIYSHSYLVIQCPKFTSEVL